MSACSIPCFRAFPSSLFRMGRPGRPGQHLPIYRLPKARSDVRPFLRSRRASRSRAGQAPRAERRRDLLPKLGAAPLPSGQPSGTHRTGLPPGYTHHPWLLGLVQALYGQMLPRNPTLSRGYLNRECQGQTFRPAFIGGCKSTDPALSDLGCDHSVRVLYAHPAIFLPASLPVPSRNILRARAIPLCAVPEMEALPDRSEKNLPVPAVSAPGHGLAACIWRRRVKAR